MKDKILLAFEVDADLHTQIKLKAVANRQTMKEYIHQLVKSDIK